jgi:group I intron endonuclease
MNTYLIKKHNIVVNLLNSIALTEFGHIYTIKNKINNKVYVGQSIRVKNRLSEHIQNVINKKNCVLYNAINKYGLENFEFSIIDFANNIDSLNEKEIYYIKFYNSNNKKIGYNIEEGGKNAKTSIETKQKLSNARKGLKQNQEWIDKRIEKVAKPVIKLDKINNTIIERYISLAEAGRLNLDNLSYEAISRKCLGISKNDNDIIWCYEEDYLNNTIKKYKEKTINKRLIEFSDEELLNMYNKHIINNISIRELSEIYSINYSTLLTYINNENKKESIFTNNNNFKYVAICKKTTKKFEDYLNKSGALTTHILEIYPNKILESKFKRKQIELTTGMPWYYDYFDFIKI